MQIIETKGNQNLMNRVNAEVLISYAVGRPNNKGAE